jgi:hypothetical protein
MMRNKLFACAAAIALAGMVACDDITDPPGGDPVDLSFAPCVGATDNPSWFAVQDGDGGWQRVTPSSGAFNFTISHGRGGIAMYNSNDGLFILYATTEELEANLPNCNGSVRSVAGSVTGYATADNIQFAMGTSNTTVFGSQSPPASFTLDAVDADVTDLIGVRYRTTSAGGTFEAFPNNVFLRRGVSGTTTSLVDFSTNEAGAPLRRDVSVTNLVANEELSVYSNVALSTTLANIAVYAAPPAGVSGAAIAPFYGVPASRLSPGETQTILVGAARRTSTVEESRFMTSLFTEPTDRALTLGPPLGNVAITGSSRPSATYTVQSDYDNLFDAVFEHIANDAPFRRVEIVATNAYLGGGSLSTVTLAVPDLSGVSGFSTSWLLIPGVQSAWTFLATDADLSILNSKPLTYKGADRIVVFTP